jgi:hypothetical protein
MKKETWRDQQRRVFKSVFEKPKPKPISDEEWKALTRQPYVVQERSGKIVTKRK